MINLEAKLNPKWGKPLNSEVTRLVFAIPFTWLVAYRDHFDAMDLKPQEIHTMRLVGDVLEVETPEMGWQPMPFLGSASPDYLEIWVDGDETSVFVVDGKIHSCHDWQWNEKWYMDYRHREVQASWEKTWAAACTACSRIVPELPPAPTGFKALKRAEKKAKEEAEKNARIAAGRAALERARAILIGNSEPKKEEPETVEAKVDYPPNLLWSPEAKKLYDEDACGDDETCECFHHEHDEEAYDADNGCMCEVCMANHNHWYDHEENPDHCDFCKEYHQHLIDKNQCQCDSCMGADDDDDDDEDEDEEWRCEGCGTDCSCCCSCGEDDEEKEDED